MFREHNEAGQTHVFKCELCKLGFGRGKAFEVHMKECHADDTDYMNEVKTMLESTLSQTLVCQVCDLQRPSTGALQRHILMEHPELRPHKCNICDARYPEKSDLKVHVWKEHEGLTSVECPACEFKCGKANSLERHLKKHHGYLGMPYTYCFVHKKGFFSYVEYRTHYRRCHMDPADRPVPKPVPKEGYPCDICGMEFGLPVRLKAHMSRVHPSERLKCDECGMPFKDKYGLIKHKVRHTDVFRCKVCGKASANQIEFDLHQGVQCGDKIFQCDLCGVKVKTTTSLRKHMKRVHSIDKSVKQLKSLRIKAPNHKSGKKNEKKKSNIVRGILSAENVEVNASDNVENKISSRKRRRDSRSQSDTLPEETTLPKRRCVRPKKSMSAEEQTSGGAGAKVPNRDHQWKIKWNLRR